MNSLAASVSAAGSSALKTLPGVARLEESLDLEGVLAAFRRRIRTFIAVLVLCACAAGVVTLTATPRYTSTVSVMLDARKRQVTGSSTEVLSQLPTEAPVVESEVQVIKSRTLAGRLVDRLNLVSDPEFNASLKPANPVATAVGRIKALIPHEPPRTLTPEEQATAQREGVIDAVLDAEDVRREGLSFVINLSLSSTDPGKAALLASTLAELYLTSQLESKFEANKRASRWLSDRLAGLRAEVSNTEHAAASYQARSGLLVSTGANLTEQRVSELLTQENQARADLAEKRARLETARRQLARGGTGEDLGEALDSPVIRELRVKFSDAQRKQAELLTHYGPLHPNVINAQHEASEIEGAIRAEIQRIVGGLEANVAASNERMNAISQGLSSARGTLAGSKSAQVGLDALERNAEASRSLYSSYLERFKQTSQQDAIQTSDAQIVSPARTPTAPTSPNTKLNLIFGLLGGLLVGAGAVFLLESVDDAVRTAADVEQKLHETYLGSVPLVKGQLADPPELITSRPLSAFSESFRHLRVSLMRANLDAKVQTVVITSALPGEGKTTTTLSFARAAATSGASVVAIDCDLRRSSLTRLVTREAPVSGLVEVLSGETPLDEALIDDATTDLRVLPMSSAQFTPKDLFGSPAMARLLAQLRERFDYVIIDSPPVLPIADAKTLAGLADAVLFLADWSRTRGRAVRHALDILRSANIRVSGVALSKVDLKAQAKHGYGDAGYFYDQYSSYYSG